MKNEKGGVALILVIWILVMLVAIVGEFSYSMRTELNILRNFKEEEEAYQLALAGIEQAKIEILYAKDSLYVYLNEDGILVFEKGEEHPERKGELGKGIFTYTITDENRKLNINTATREQLKYITETSGVELTEADTIVDSIMDWRDTNDLHMLNGAEEDYYQSLPAPYSCKDGPFDTVDELLLVKGVTEEIFKGSTENKDEKKYKGIAEYFTTWASNINVNTSPLEVLEAVLGNSMAQNIITQRGTDPITTAVSGGTIQSSVFTIISTGSTSKDAIKRSIKTVLIKNGEKLESVYWNDNFVPSVNDS